MGTTIENRKKLPLVPIIVAASLTLLTCFTCFAIVLAAQFSSPPATESESTPIQQSGAATDTITPTPRPPTESPTPSSIPPTATPPTPSSTPQPTTPAGPSPTPSLTLSPSVTPTRRPSSTPAPDYIPLVGNIWADVEVYYGAGSNKSYGFQILGGSEDCPSLPSGRGVYVHYEDGTDEWKDRNYLISSGLFFILKDDPARSSLVWYVYSFCP